MKDILSRLLILILLVSCSGSEQNSPLLIGDAEILIKGLDFKEYQNEIPSDLSNDRLYYDSLNQVYLNINYTIDGTMYRDYKKERSYKHAHNPLHERNLPDSYYRIYSTVDFKKDFIEMRSLKYDIDSKIEGFEKEVIYNYTVIDSLNVFSFSFRKEYRNFNAYLFSEWADDLKSRISISKRR